MGQNSTTRYPCWLFQIAPYCEKTQSKTNQSSKRQKHFEQPHIIFSSKNLDFRIISIADEDRIKSNIAFAEDLPHSRLCPQFKGKWREIQICRREDDSFSDLIFHGHSIGVFNYYCVITATFSTGPITNIGLDAHIKGNREPR